MKTAFQVLRRVSKSPCKSDSRSRFQKKKRKRKKIPVAPDTQQILNDPRILSGSYDQTLTETCPSVPLLPSPLLQRLTLQGAMAVPPPAPPRHRIAAELQAPRPLSGLPGKPGAGLGIHSWCMCFFVLCFHVCMSAEDGYLKPCFHFLSRYFNVIIYPGMTCFNWICVQYFLALISQ